MKRFKLAVTVVVVLAVIIAGIWWLVGRPAASKTQEILTSGFIEARNVGVGFEGSGRIVEITAAEGDRVEAGKTLVKLDDALLQAQKQQAEANVRLAQAYLDQAKVSQQGSKKAWDDALDVQRNPLELNGRITAAQSALQMAELDLKRITDLQNELELATAQNRLDTAQKVLDNLKSYRGTGLVSYYESARLILPAEGELNSATLNLNYLKQMETSWTLPSALLRRDSAKNVLDNLMAIKANPQTINTAVDQAETAYQLATAAVKAVSLQVEQAQASLKVIEVQLAKLTSTSPVTGVVSARNAEVGEIAKPGVPILTITALDEVTLTAYVPESKIGLVKLGQKAVVLVDSYPADSFSGKVTFISPQAQFTPRDVQLKEEREKTVFAVKIKLANPDQKLKPGMPADATIVTD